MNKQGSLKTAAVMAAVALASFGASNANAVSYATDPSVTVTTPAIIGSATTGALMNGMLISATFANSFSQTLAWAATGLDSGGVTGTDWGLSVAGDTFSANWTFVNTIGSNLVQLTLNGAPGQTMFDTVFGADTPGSFSATTFVENPTAAGVATFSRRVALLGNAPAGDLWDVLSVSFTGGGVAGGFTFQQDTDNGVTLTAAIPEPSTYALMLAGLGFVGFVANRRRKSQVSAVA
jgi:hypothetical protein